MALRVEEADASDVDFGLERVEVLLGRFGVVESQRGLRVYFQDTSERFQAADLAFDESTPIAKERQSQQDDQCDQARYQGNGDDLAGNRKVAQALLDAFYNG